MATPRGLLKAGWSFRKIGLLVGKSDSYVRQAFGGNRRKDRPVSDELREQTYADLVRLVHEKTGDTPPSRLDKPATPPVVSEIEMPLRGGKRIALQVGHADSFDRNGNITGKPVTKRVTAGQLAKLLSDAIARYGHISRWIIAVYGERMVTSAFDSFGKLGKQRGWWSKGIDGASVAGQNHPAFQHALDLTAEINQAHADMPQAISPEVEKQLRRELGHRRGHYVEEWAQRINGQEWLRVFAVWIAPAVTYTSTQG